MEDVEPRVRAEQRRRPGRRRSGRRRRGERPCGSGSRATRGAPPAASVRSTVADDEVEAEVTSRSRHRRRLPSAGSGHARSCPSSSPHATPRRRSPRPCRASSVSRYATSSSSSSTTGRTTGPPASWRSSRTSGSRSSGTTTPLGLAGALNVGLDAARGTYVARMDADDVALPGWLDAVLGRIAREPRVAVVGTGMIDLLPRRRARNGPPHGRRARRRALGRAVLVAVLPLDRRRRPVGRSSSTGSATTPRSKRARTTTSGRACSGSPTATTFADALVLYRKHDAQASARRAELQLECRRRVALRQIEALAPTLAGGRARARVARRWRAAARGRHARRGSRRAP